MKRRLFCDSEFLYCISCTIRNFVHVMPIKFLKSFLERNFRDFEFPVLFHLWIIELKESFSSRGAFFIWVISGWYMCAFLLSLIYCHLCCLVVHLFLPFIFNALLELHCLKFSGRFYLRWSYFLTKVLLISSGLPFRSTLLIHDTSG